MNEEIIKKLIQLTPEQQELLRKAEDAITALSDSGVAILWDDEACRLFTFNVSNFEYCEIADSQDEKGYIENGYIKVPYWEGSEMSDYISRMWPDDCYFAIPRRCDRNLFNH